MIKNIMEKIIKFIKKIKNKKGFTLVELLAVIVLLAGISVISIPAVIGNMTKAKEKAFNTVGETMVKYLESNYEACKLGDGTIVKYDEDIFDSNCELKNENLTDLSKNLINNSGYSKKDIERIEIIQIGDGKFGVVVYPTTTGKFSSFKNKEQEANNAYCWTVEPITENKYKLAEFHGINHETGEVVQGCGVTKDENGYYSVTIPSKVGDKNISTLGNELFSAVNTTEDGTIIGINQFINIEKITINEGIAIIEDGFVDGDNKGKGTFMGIGGDLATLAPNVERTLEVKFPSTLTHIGVASFIMASLREIEIPKKVETIGALAFNHTSLLSNLKLKTDNNGDSNLKTIGQSSFQESGISSLEIPSSVETIEEFAFSDNKNLTTLTFKSNSKLKTINKYAFDDNKINSLEIPSSVEFIGEYAFSNNKNLTKLTFKSNSKLKTIDIAAFWDCGIKNLKIPSSVETIGLAAFKDNVQLTELTFEVDKNSNSNLKTIDDGAFMSDDIRILEIPSSVEFIGERSFYSNIHLTNLTFKTDKYGNSNLKEMENSVFENCDLTYTDSSNPLIIPNSVTSIGGLSFSSLTSGNDTEPKNRYLKYIRFNGTLKEDNSADWYNSGQTQLVP